MKGQQAAVLSALLSSPSVAEAADVGVSDRTIWRYHSDPDFQTAYRAARRAAVEHTIMRLQADSAHAAKVLRDVADDTQAPASARVAAARAIIEQAIRGVELQELAERIDALEAAQRMK